MREWIPFSGRDGEGEKFDDLCLVDSANGQILATVALPRSGEYWYGVDIRIPDDVERGYGAVRFIDLEPAKRFCEETVDTSIAMAFCRGVADKEWRKAIIRNLKRREKRSKVRQEVPC
jgi:hypothetical protein